MEELIVLYAGRIADIIQNYLEVDNEASSQADKDYAPVEAFNEILDLLNVRR